MKKISIKMIKIMLLLVVGVCLFSIASKVSAFTIEPKSATLKEGEVLKFEAYDDDGKNISRKIRWRTEATSVATISYSSGELTAKKAGTVTIKAEHYDTKEIIKFTVTVIEDDKITLNKTSITMEIDGDEELIALNSKGEEISDSDIEWTSSDDTIAKIKKGEIEPVKAGSVTITAKHKRTGATATSTVTVEEPEKEEEKKETTSSTISKPATSPAQSTPVAPDNPTTSSNPAKPIAGTGEEEVDNQNVGNNDDLTMSDVLPETDEKEIEEVTNAATNGGFSINGLLSKITEIINKIINSIFNIINIGLNR